MPTYVYRCPDGHETDEVRRVADMDIPFRCECGAAAARVEIAGAPAYVTRPGVGDRSPFSRDRVGK